jgi:hypothetical protein
MVGYMDPWAMVSNKSKNQFWPGATALKQIEEPILNCRFLQETLRFFYFCFKTLEPEVITNYPTTGNDLLWNIISILVLSLMTCCCDEFALPSCNLLDPRSEN